MHSVVASDGKQCPEVNDVEAPSPMGSLRLVPAAYGYHPGMSAQLFFEQFVLGGAHIRQEILVFLELFRSHEGTSASASASASSPSLRTSKLRENMFTRIYYM